MNWTELLKSGADGAYHATEGLIALVDDDSLDWKPETGENWMTTGQLLMHITCACGACMKGFVTGDWSMPEGAEMDDAGDEMLPPAEVLPTVQTVAEAVERLSADKDLAHVMIERAGEEDLAHKLVAAPWNPEEKLPLGHHLLGMVQHLSQHKGQLFYYLKLQGKPVHTGTLWGM